MYPIAFVTTCKGRLHHIQQTLASIVTEAPAEIILVDYACPDNTGDWVEANFPTVKVIRVNDDPGFCLPRARNIGAAHSSAPWLCFIDADIKVKTGWLAWMQAHLRSDSFYRASLLDGKQLQEIAGTLICPRAAFDQIGGYDEVFRGWGGEDIDLYARLAELTATQPSHYPHSFIEPIGHADAERTTFHAIKDIRIQSLINGCYVKAKSHLHRQGVREIPFATRQRMLETISNSLKHHRTPPKTFAIRLQVENLSSSNGMPFELLIEVAKKRRYGLFGARQTRVRNLPQPLLQRWLGAAR